MLSLQPGQAQGQRSQKSPQQFGCHHCRIAVALNLTSTLMPLSPSPLPLYRSPLHHLPHHRLPLPLPSLSPVPTSSCHIMLTLTLTLTFPSHLPDGSSSHHPHFTLPYPCFTLAQPLSLCTKPKQERCLLMLLSCHITITLPHHCRSTLV